jgi:lipopolysaccharide export system permease protein
MKILDRYIFSQYMRTFIFSTVAFASIFIVISMVEKIGKLMDMKLGTFEIIKYYLFSIPTIFLVTSPVSSLLSSMLVSGRLSFSSELPAIRSAGVSMKQFLVPFALGGTIISSLNLFNACWLAPTSYPIVNSFEKQYINHSNQTIAGTSNIHILEPGNRIVSIGIIGENAATLKNVSIENLDKSHLVSRTDAESLYYNPGTREWIMHNVSTRTFKNGKEAFTLIQQQPVKLSFTPRSLKELDLNPDEMNLVHHYRYLDEKQKAGFSGLERSIVTFHTKFSMPLASLIIVFIGVPLSARKKRGGLAGEIGITLLIGLLYLALQKVFAIAGEQGALNPVLAAWLPDILFAGIGYAILKTSLD